MKKTTRIILVGLVALVLGGVMLWSGGMGRAGEEEALAKKLDAITAAVEKGDMMTVKDLAKKLAKEQGEVYYVMLLMKPRSKNGIMVTKNQGIGVGEKMGTIKPDGIEFKLREMTKNAMPKAQLKKESEALIKMGNRMAAIAHFSRELPPTKGLAKWNQFSSDFQKLSAGFVKAIKTQEPVEVKKAATKLNANCNQCHSIFR